MNGKRQLRAKLYGYAGYRLIQGATSETILVQAPSGEEKRVLRNGLDLSSETAKRFVFAAFGRDE